MDTPTVMLAETHAKTVNQYQATKMESDEIEAEEKIHKISRSLASVVGESLWDAAAEGGDDDDDVVVTLTGPWVVIDDWRSWYITWTATSRVWFSSE